MKTPVCLVLLAVCVPLHSLAQRAPTFEPVIEVRPPEMMSRGIDRIVGSLAPQVVEKHYRRVAVTTDNPLVPDFVAEFAVLSQDVAAKYRAGYVVKDHGTLYIRGDVMYKPKGGSGSALYGIASVGHATGPAARLRW